VIIPGTVTFKPGTALLDADGIQALAIIKTYLEDKAMISLLRVEGHVYNTSNDQSLSEARAMAVCKWLTGAGIDCKRLLPVGFGPNKPIVAEGNNTRIAFFNAALRGRLIGGMPADGGGQLAGETCPSTDH